MYSKRRPADSGRVGGARLAASFMTCSTSY